MNGVLVCCIVTFWHKTIALTESTTISTLTRAAAMLARRPRIWFIWSMRCSAVLQHCWERVQSLARLGVDCQIFVTQEEAASAFIVGDTQECGITVNASRPNLRDIFCSVATHYKMHHEQALRCMGSDGRDGCALMCCGPASLICAAKDAAATHSSGMPVEMHEEVFQF